MDVIITPVTESVFDVRVTAADADFTALVAEAEAAAAIATTKAGEASVSASTASTQAEIATTKAGEASASATAAEVSNQASLVNKNSSEASATLAGEKANLATTEAAIATAKAAEALQIVSTVDGVSLAEVKTFNSSVEKKTKNIFDKSQAVLGRILLNGTLATDSSNWVASGFCTVIPLTLYSVQGFQTTNVNVSAVAWYDESKVFISSVAGDGLAGKNRQYTSPANAAFARFTIANVVGIGLTPTDNIHVNAFMVEEGSFYSTYEPFIPIGFIKPSSIFNPSELEPSNAYYSFDKDGYLGNGKFMVYIRVKENIYIGFEIIHFLDLSDAIYSNQWRISLAKEYVFINNSFSLTGNSYMVDGDSEGVYRTNDKHDFSGGVHGDETLINVKFFASGIEIKNLSSDISLTPCQNFKLLQKSNTHEAPATGNVPNLSHPIETERIKEIVFDNKGYEIFNRWTWINAPNTAVQFFYHGISSISKDTAKEGYSDKSFDTVNFTGTNTNLLSNIGPREFKANNDLKGISVSVTSKLLKPSASDDLCNMFVWDRANDSKYYRNINTSPSTVGSVIESIMTVEWSKL